MHAKGPKTIRTPNFVLKVQKIINKGLRKLIRAIIKDLRGTIRRVGNEGVLYKWYMMHRGQFISEKNIKRIYAKCLLSKLKHQEAGMLSFVSNEKNFDQDQKVNQRNHCWLCRGPTEVPRVIHTKFPAIHNGSGNCQQWERYHSFSLLFSGLKSQCCCLSGFGQSYKALNR